MFEQYQRSEKALVAALAQMYVQGVSTRKVAAITEELCGHAFSASSISAITARLDAQRAEFSRRPLRQEFPYVIVDARYERVREGGVIGSRAILIALGIDWEGRRQVLAVAYARRESPGRWQTFLRGLQERGLRGVRLVVSDDPPGIAPAAAQAWPGAWWQRCYVHFLRNALDHLPRKADDDCLQELRWMYERRDVEEARRDLRLWLEKWAGKYPKLCAWVGGGHRGDLDVLPSAPGASQASQEHQPAGALQPGDQAADAGGADLPGRAQLPAVGTGRGRGAARGLDGRQPLPEHGLAAATRGGAVVGRSLSLRPAAQTSLRLASFAPPRFTSVTTMKSILLNLTHTTDWRVFATLAQLLMRKAARRYRQDPGREALPELVYALDASILHLSLKLFPWAFYPRSRASALKLHLLLAWHGRLPAWAAITEATFGQRRLLFPLATTIIPHRPKVG